MSIENPLPADSPARDERDAIGLAHPTVVPTNYDPDAPGRRRRSE